MQKIPTLFLRDFTQSRNPLTTKVNPECSWVLTGTATPRRKWDGTAIWIYRAPGGESTAFKRATVKGAASNNRSTPEGFVMVDSDPVTDTAYGWVPTSASNPEDRWLYDAFARDDAEAGDYSPGTYELCGPKINGNPEGLDRHVLLKHMWAPIVGTHVPTSFSELLNFFAHNDIEGIVWYENGGQGRMAKIKGTDFNIKRGKGQINIPTEPSFVKEQFQARESNNG